VSYAAPLPHLNFWSLPVGCTGGRLYWKMRKILSGAAMAAMVLLAWGADGAVPVKKAPAKKSAAKSTAATKKPAGTAARTTTSRSTASSRRAGQKPVSRVTWRNRQMAPTPERYKEIQSALVSKGYLQPDEAGGTWNQASMDALKKFQSEQNLESTGKINSLSLIALGLGPKHDAPAVPTKAPPDPGQ
jgi:hypothetical protein